MPSENVMLVGTLIPIAAIIMGGLLLLVPVLGLTLRFAIKPALESLGHLRALKLQGQELHLVEQRLALLEEQMRALSLAARGEVVILPPAPQSGPSGLLTGERSTAD
jgi:hypothetical protein